MVVEKLTFDDYYTHSQSTAFFLDELDKDKQKQIVRFGFNEEVNELLTDTDYPDELRELLWGKEVRPEVAHKLQAEKTSEAGDVLYFVAAGCMLKKVSFGQLCTRAIELYSGQKVVDVDGSFAKLDDEMKARMPDAMPADYDPNYFGMQFWNLSPFDKRKSGADCFDGLGQAVKGPLVLDGDGLYVIERLSRNFGEYFAANLDNEFFVRSSALLLGGLSAVLQNRLNSSLETAAMVNIAKRERRLQAHTAVMGEDQERSRAEGSARPELSGWESTVLNLLYGQTSA